MTNQYPPNVQKFIDEQGEVGKMFIQEIIESERRKAVEDYKEVVKKELTKERGHPDHGRRIQKSEPEIIISFMGILNNVFTSLYPEK